MHFFLGALRVLKKHFIATNLLGVFINSDFNVFIHNCVGKLYFIMEYPRIPKVTNLLLSSCFGCFHLMDNDPPQYEKMYLSPTLTSHIML